MLQGPNQVLQDERRDEEGLRDHEGVRGRHQQHAWGNYPTRGARHVLLHLRGGPILGPRDRLRGEGQGHPHIPVDDRKDEQLARRQHAKQSIRGRVFPVRSIRQGRPIR